MLEKVLQYFKDNPSVLADILSTACVNCRLNKELEDILDIPHVSFDDTCKNCKYDTGICGCEKIIHKALINAMEE